MLRMCILIKNSINCTYYPLPSDVANEKSLYYSFVQCGFQEVRVFGTEGYTVDTGL